MAVAEQTISKTNVTHEFFKDLYGKNAPGNLIIFSINKKTNRRTSYTFKPVSELVKAAKKVEVLSKNKNLQVYFSMGLQKNVPPHYKRGTAAGVIALPGFWLDVDVKGPGHKEKKLPETLNDAVQFVKNVMPLPPSKIIFSGGGIYPFWLFKEPWRLDSEEEWQAANTLSRRFQKTFKEAAHKRGWNLDSTPDLNRVLRPPGSFNNKYDEPKEVITIEDQPDIRYNPQDFDPHLEEVESSTWDGFATAEYPPGDIKLILELPRLASWVLSHRQELKEPEWYAVLSILGRCENGQELAHEWSRDYSGYSYAETQSKLEQVLKKAGPYTCEYIREYLNSEFCKDCKANVNSPSVLGLRSLPGDDFKELNWSSSIGGKDSNSSKTPQTTTGSYFDERGTFIPAYLADELLTTFFIKYAASDLWVYKNGVYKPDGENKLAMEAQRRLRSYTRTNRIKETIDYIKRQTFTTLPAPNKNIINVKNGRLDWRTGELHKHSPGHFEIVQLPVEYDPAASCPVFDKYLKTTLTEDSAQLALEILGYCLAPDTRFEKAFMFTGTGRNGKSIFLSVIDNLIGSDNVSHIALQDLEENRFKAAGLLGKLVNTFADLDNRALKSTTLLKMLTSGDPIDAERKFRDGFSFTNYARLIFSANTIPRSSDTTFAFYERWIILPFTQVFDASNPDTDPDLREKLATPQELSGIFNHALAGLRRLYQQRGFTMPESVKQALDEYKRQNDSVLAFCDECTELKADGYTIKPLFYESYCTWCEQQGLKPVSQVRLKQRLLQARPTVEDGRETRSGPRVWKGIELTDDAPTISGFLS
jgi:P4 family phage/plasmid primase-like protien